MRRPDPSAPPAAVPGRSATPAAPRPARPSAPTSTTPLRPRPPSALDGLRPRRLLAPSDRPHRSGALDQGSDARRHRVPSLDRDRRVGSADGDPRRGVGSAALRGGLRRAVYDHTGLATKERRGLLGETASLLQSPNSWCPPRLHRSSWLASPRSPRRVRVPTRGLTSDPTRNATTTNSRVNPPLEHVARARQRG